MADLTFLQRSKIDLSCESNNLLAETITICLICAAEAHDIALHHFGKAAGEKQDKRSKKSLMQNDNRFQIF